MHLPFMLRFDRQAGLDITKQRSTVRRFRPGLDYTLATPSHWDVQGEDMILDAVLCFVGEPQCVLLYVNSLKVAFDSCLNDGILASKTTVT